MNSKKERINKAVAYLKGEQIIKFQKDIMDAMKADKTTVSQALLGNEKYLTEKYLIRFADVFPVINAEWLLTGDGEMLKSDIPAIAKNQIRYWTDVDATAGGVQLFDDSMTNAYIDLSIPEFRDCTDAVNLYGDSMLPTYKSGQIIILKKWTENFIDFGNVYLIVTKSGNRMVKYIRKGSDSTHVLCASENKDFDAFEIEKTDILYLYLVKGGISKNTL